LRHQFRRQAAFIGLGGPRLAVDAGAEPLLLLLVRSSNDRLSALYSGWQEFARIQSTVLTGAAKTARGSMRLTTSALP